ncbi:hypothetical protein RB601_005606 [Gaeumannomyces tritici]
MAASHLAEFRLRSGSLNVQPSSSSPSSPSPVAAAAAAHNQHVRAANGSSVNAPMAAANQRFDGPRSPPNTSHVPCKFFRQGACQAGNACPFSHDLSMAAENVCKYFAKGNCKFGPKCANIHVLPDGRRINYGKNGVTVAPTPTINLGSRVNPNTYHQSSNSALTNSFMRGVDAPVSPYGAPNPYMSADDRYAQHHLGRQPSLENGLPTIDTTYSSNPASVYGSPRDDEASRFGLGLSPGNAKGLSVLDAPLPASFDSQGISLAARYGPWPSSVPSKFGLESPSASLNAAKDARTSETLKLLHTSAFGSNDRLSSSTLTANEMGFFGSVGGGLATGSSPPVHLGEEYFGKRAMHSQRFAKPRMLSASAPKVDRDWEAEFLFLEEDYVPSALANDVLTPQEKARRGSVRLDEPATGGGSEAASSSLPKFGSLGTSPSSRWGPIFQRQRSDDDSGSAEPGIIPGKSMKYATSAFGHVGSPLRNSSLAIDVEMNGGLSSLTNGASQSRRAGNDSFSALTQQLQHTSLGENGDVVGNGSSPRLHPNSARSTSGLGYVASSGLAAALKQERDGGREHRGMERHVSSGSIGSGRFTTPIDEEDPAFVFNMEEDDPSSGQGQQQQQQSQQSRTRKRISGGLGANGWISYAGIAAAGARSSAVNGSKPREVPGAVEAVGGR